MTALLSFTRRMSFIHCEYSEKVKDIHLDVFQPLDVCLVVHRSDSKSFESHIVFFILINFSLAAHCFHQ